MKTKKSAGTPVSGPKHETNSNPRLDKELDALHLKVKGWSVNETGDRLIAPWLDFASVMLLVVFALISFFLPVYLKAGTWIIGFGFFAGVCFIIAVLGAMNSQFRRVDEYNKFYQTQWTCDSETISKLAIASHLLGLADKICGLEIGISVLRSSKHGYRKWVKDFLIDKLVFERDSLSESFDHLILSIEYEFGLLVERPKVFGVLDWGGHNPERIEFVPKTFELPAK